MQNKSIYKHSWGQFEKRINYELDWGLLLSALSKLGLMEEIVLNENDQQYCTPKIWQNALRFNDIIKLVDKLMSVWNSIRR